MDYEEACRKYRKELEELYFLKTRLKTAKKSEVERIQKNIDSRNISIGMLKKWFKLTRNKIPEIP